MLEIISRRDMQGTSLGLFCYGYAWYFLLSWLPSYLAMERHLSIRAMAFFGALPFCASGLSALLAGWLSDRLIARGATAPNKVLIAGTGIESATETLKLTEYAAQLGYDVALVRTPHYYKNLVHKMDAQILYFRAVADQVKIPVMALDFRRSIMRVSMDCNSS
jgi:hypothetical protein